jgi:hypothetical protein
MAAATQVQGAAGKAALLGFAGGGMMGPLRALGGQQEVEAVDLCDKYFHVFHDLCRSWCGRVRFHHADAVSWLQETASRYDVILEDLSVAVRGDIIKPEVAWTALPGLMRKRVVKGGMILSNLLRPKDMSWTGLASRILGPEGRGVWVIFDEFENRLLVSGRVVPSAAEFSRLIRAQLGRINSRLTHRIQVRAIRPAP